MEAVGRLVANIKELEPETTRLIEIAKRVNSLLQTESNLKAEIQREQQALHAAQMQHADIVRSSNEYRDAINIVIPLKIKGCDVNAIGTVYAVIKQYEMNLEDLKKDLASYSNLKKFLAYLETKAKQSQKELEEKSDQIEDKRRTLDRLAENYEQLKHDMKSFLENEITAAVKKAASEAIKQVRSEISKEEKPTSAKSSPPQQPQQEESPSAKTASETSPSASANSGFNFKGSLIPQSPNINDRKSTKED